MRNSLKTLLFLSAFSPVLFSVAYVKWDSHGFHAAVVYLVVLGVVGTIVPLVILAFVAKKSETMPLQVKKIESNDFMVFVFVVSYLFPLAAKASELDFSRLIIFVLGLALVLWLINSIPAHPLLHSFRFRFYKVESASGMVYTLISRREIVDPRSVRAVKAVSSSMLLEVPNGV